MTSCLSVSPTSFDKSSSWYSFFAATFHLKYPALAFYVFLLFLSFPSAFFRLTFFTSEDCHSFYSDLYLFLNLFIYSFAHSFLYCPCISKLRPPRQHLQLPTFIFICILPRRSRPLTLIFNHVSCTTCPPTLGRSTSGKSAFLPSLTPLQQAKWKQSPPPAAAFYFLYWRNSQSQRVGPQTVSLSR